MYILLDQEEIIAAFALCDANAGENEIERDNCSDKVIYLDRLGVNIRI